MPVTGDNSEGKRYVWALDAWVSEEEYQDWKRRDEEARRRYRQMIGDQDDTNALNAYEKMMGL